MGQYTELIKITVYNSKTLFLTSFIIVYSFLTFFDAYLYSLVFGYSAEVSVLIALSRFFIYLPFSLLLALYVVFVAPSFRLRKSRKNGAAGFMGAIFAGIFSFVGCPPCLFGLLILLSSLGLLTGGLFFSILLVQQYSGIIFVIGIVGMIVGLYVMMRSMVSCRIFPVTNT